MDILQMLIEMPCNPASYPDTPETCSEENGDSYESVRPFQAMHFPLLQCLFSEVVFGACLEMNRTFVRLLNLHYL